MAYLIWTGLQTLERTLELNLDFQGLDFAHSIMTHLSFWCCNFVVNS